jgi:hypothetical protein
VTRLRKLIVALLVSVGLMLASPGGSVQTHPVSPQDEVERLFSKVEKVYPSRVAPGVYYVRVNWLWNLCVMARAPDNTLMFLCEKLPNEVGGKRT